MSYLHCHNCDFSQDDFWDKNYNPITFLEKNYTKELLNENLDGKQVMDETWLEENKYEQHSFTKRKSIIHELKRAIRKIENMRYRTFEEFKIKNPNKICPECNKRELDIC